MATTPAPALVAALDTSGQHAALAVVHATTGAVLLNRDDLPITGGSTGLVPVLQGCLRELAITPAGIGAWTVGMGPGSFTGVRVGAALVLGLCAATGARHRGLPSSLALALAAAPVPGERLAVLYDGRRGQMLVSQYHATPAGLLADAEPAAVALTDLAALPVARFVILATDAALKLLLPAVQARTTVVPRFDARLLLDPAGWPWPTDAAGVAASLEPVYVRPPVFIAPAPPSRIVPS